MTAYDYSEADRAAGKEDPNRDVALCEPCHNEYEIHWREMWEDYHSSLM